MIATLAAWFITPHERHMTWTFICSEPGLITLSPQITPKIRTDHVHLAALERRGCSLLGADFFFFLQWCSAASHGATINPNLHVFQHEPLADLLQHRTTLAWFKHITACNTFLSREVFVKCGISTPTTSLWFDKIITSDLERQVIKRFSFSLYGLWIYLTYPCGKEPIDNVCTVEANLFV